MIVLCFLQTPFIACVASVASVSVRFRRKEGGTRVTDRKKSAVSKRGGRGARVKVRVFHFLALVSFLARSKPKVPFLGISLLRNHTEALATQAKIAVSERPR